MTDFSVEHPNCPEILARIGEVLGAAGVNIEGLCAFAHARTTVIHFAVQDAVTAHRVLADAGITVQEVSEVFVLDKNRMGVTGRPGSFGQICRALANNGIKLRFSYPAENNRYVLGLDDAAKARDLLG